MKHKLLTAALLAASTQAIAGDWPKAYPSCEDRFIFDVTGDKQADAVCLPKKADGSNTGALWVNGMWYADMVPEFFTATNVEDVNSDGLKDIAGWKQCPTCNKVTFDYIPGFVDCPQIDPTFLTYGTFPDGDVGTISWVQADRYDATGEHIIFTYPTGTVIRLDWDLSHNPVSCNGFTCQLPAYTGWGTIPPGVTFIDVGVIDSAGKPVRQCLYNPE